MILRFGSHKKLALERTTGVFNGPTCMNEGQRDNEEELSLCSTHPSSLLFARDASLLNKRPGLLETLLLNAASHTRLPLAAFKKHTIRGRPSLLGGGHCY